MGNERALRYLRGRNSETGESSGRKLESPTSSQEATIQGSSARRSTRKNPIKRKRESENSPERLSYKRIAKNPIKRKRESENSPERLSYKRIGEQSAMRRRQREEGPQRLSVSSQGATIQGSSARISRRKNPIKRKRESEKSPERLSYKRIGEQSAKRTRQREEGPQRSSVCGICMDRKTKAEMFKSNKCSHSYCNACVSQHLAAKISENILKVKCPDLACNAVLEPQDCRAVVSQQVVDRWEDALCEYALGSEKIYCPFKDCSAPLVDDGMQVVTTAECPHCHRLFCALCMVPWHAGYDCKNEGDKMDMKFMKLAEKEMWQKCPNCKFYVQRTHGCESITCRCGHQFCYVCGKRWLYGHLCLTN